MRTNLLLLVQIHIDRIGRHMEQPDLIVELLPQAAHRLICPGKPEESQRNR